MDDSDILNFGQSQRVSFKDALRGAQPSRSKPSTVVSPPDSSLSSEFSDDEEGGRHGRKRKHLLGGREGSLASRLIHNQIDPCVISSDSEEDEDFGLGEK